MVATITTTFSRAVWCFNYLTEPGTIIHKTVSVPDVFQKRTASCQRYNSSVYQYGTELNQFPICIEIVRGFYTRIYRYVVQSALLPLTLNCIHFYIGFRHQTWRNLKATSSLRSAAPTFWYPAWCSPESLGSKGSRTWTRSSMSRRLRDTATGNSTR